MPRSQLLELYAHGLGVIDDARLEFGEGFNVITGETGAGKTLLLGALELCLGAESPTSRYAVLSDMRAAVVFKDGTGQEVVLTRETGTSGRLRSTLNGAPSSAEVLRTLASELIVIHGQHDSLALRNRSEILRIIDASGDVDSSALEAVRSSLREALQLRASLGGDSDARDRDLDFLRFQIGELEGVNIVSPDELGDTLSSLERLTTLREDQSSLTDVLDELDGDDERAVLARFARAIQRIPPGDVYTHAREALRDSLILAREGASELARLADPESYDPEVLQQLDDRVAVLQRIVRKYGGTLGSALVELDRLRTQLNELLGAEERLIGLDEEIVHHELRVRELSREVRRQREFAAVKLTEAVRRQLPRVALTNALLRFVVEGDDGSDAQILFTPNPGLPEGPLQSLASGGELSRVLLALSLETAHQDVVAVFDEVDAGVGGQVAQQIGQCLREVGREQQVLAVTHLASVAAQADHHFLIEKSTSHGVTATRVRQVTGEERVNEIARMLAGDEITEEAKALARRLLETSR